MGSLCKKLLVLDLDNTLVFASISPINYDFIVSVKGQKFWVRKRPGLDLFLTRLAEEYDIAIWTASVLEYTEPVLRNIIPEHIKLRFVFDRKRCTQKKVDLGDITTFQFIKPLKKIWRRTSNSYNNSNTIVVDDRSITYCRNYGNAILVPGFYGTDDEVLYRLMIQLKFLADVPDIRLALKKN
jgi:carboxy-terminal domain RNA polymerase II polypeptide A small phosphatase